MTVECHDAAIPYGCMQTLYFKRQYKMPYMTDAVIPKTITGPAIMNIFALMPVMMPSLLNSSAGAATEFANPVIGTSVPAPENFAMLS